MPNWTERFRSVFRLGETRETELERQEQARLLRVQQEAPNQSQNNFFGLTSYDDIIRQREIARQQQQVTVEQSQHIYQQAQDVFQNLNVYGQANLLQNSGMAQYRIQNNYLDTGPWGQYTGSTFVFDTETGAIRAVDNVKPKAKKIKRNLPDWF